LKKIMPVLAAAIVTFVPHAQAQSGDSAAQEIIALERRAMDGWLKGNPDPLLEISDPQITYFHAVVQERIEGLPALKALYERYRGVPLFDGYEILSPKVQISGEVAVLTYQLARHNGAVTTQWNATQVYQRKKEGWRVIHTHWSAAKAGQP
jgi:hypothetical protein